VGASEETAGVGTTKNNIIRKRTKNFVLFWLTGLLLGTFIVFAFRWNVLNALNALRLAPSIKRGIISSNFIDNFREKFLVCLNSEFSHIPN